MALTDMTVRNTKPQDRAYKLTDSNGLFLFISPAGSKLWRFRYRFENKEQTFSIGPYPAISLSEARTKRDDARKLLANGINPAQQKRDVKEEKASIRTFETVAREWHKSNRNWDKDHAVRILTSLENHLFPLLGKRNIAELNTRDLLQPVKAVEAKGNIYTAGRLQSRITNIMRFAVQNAYITYNPAHDMRGAVTAQKTEHHPALPFCNMTTLLEKIGTYQGQPLTILAIRLALLIFIRSSELRFARWNEIDFSRSLWTIPEKRQEIPGVKYSTRGAKMRTPHLVPLCKQAVAILEQIKEISADFLFVFPGAHTLDKPMSENTVNKALRTLGYNTKTDICGHGFRTMACSALNEASLWSKDAIERRMSHKERNGVRAAYIHKAEHLEERREMMQWWSDYLDICREGFVAPYIYARQQKVA